MEARMDGLRVLVTGSTQGVGRAVAEAALASGAAAVVVTGRDVERGEAVASELGATFVRADLAADGAVGTLWDAATRAMGGVDVLVNSAGISTRATLLDAEPDLWRFLFRVNAEAPFFLMQRMVTDARARKAPGAIVNMLSMNMHGGHKDLAVYAATKAALGLATKDAAQHYRFDRVRANGIAVGWADTPGERKMQAEDLGKGEGWLAEAEAAQPSGRLLKTTDIARLAVYLASPASEPMTGAIIDQEQWVSGGIDG